jgi:hypothetical protein
MYISKEESQETLPLGTYENGTHSPFTNLETFQLEQLEQICHLAGKN